MTDTKHTPGPWTISPPNRGNLSSIVGANGEKIATVYRPCDEPLTAAAPELLEALEIALAKSEQLAGELCQLKGANPRRRLQQRLQGIRLPISRAIAKAKGAGQ